MHRLLQPITVAIATCILCCPTARADIADDDTWGGEDDDTGTADDDTGLADDDSAAADDDDQTGAQDDDDQTGDDDDDGGGCSHIASPRVPSMAIPVLLSGLATLLFLAWRRD